MKQPVLIIMCVCLLGACSVNNRIQSNKANGLKKLSLIQIPKTYLLQQNAEVIAHSGLKATTAYLFEEIVNARPLVTLKFNIDRPQNTIHDSIVFIVLDGENIQLYSLAGRFIIPENLWVPMVHSQNIQYLLKMNHDQLVLRLNDKQKTQLTGFFNRAIQQRDHVFPAVPPGMKKW